MLPESLNLGQRNLEDVFLELTGRGLSSTGHETATDPGPRDGGGS